MLDSEDSLDNFKYFQKPQQERSEKPNTSSKMEIEPSPSVKKSSNQRLDTALTPRDQNRLSTTSNTRSEPDSGKLVIRKEAPVSTVSRPSSSAMVEERKVSDTTSRKSISEKPQTPRNNKMRAEESEEEEEAEETDSENSDDSDDDDSESEEEADDSDDDEPVRKRSKLLVRLYILNI